MAKMEKYEVDEDLLSSPDKIYNAVVAEGKASGDSSYSSFKMVETYDGNNQDAVMYSLLHDALPSIFRNQTTRNSFIRDLYNVIAKSFISNKVWEFPYSHLFKGTLDFGETVQELYVKRAKMFNFDPEVAEHTLHKRVLPDVRAAFHTLNYKKFWKVTTTKQELRQAFYSWNGLNELVERIIASLAHARNTADFTVFKYMLARLYLNGFMAQRVLPALSLGDADEIVRVLRETSGEFRFEASNVSYAGVPAFSMPETQNLLYTTQLASYIDVGSQSSAYNLEFVSYIGKRDMINRWDVWDEELLAQVFEDDPDYTYFTVDELTRLSRLHAIHFDDEFLQIYNYQEDDYYSQFNPQGLYENHWLHAWRIWSASPFAACVAYVEEANVGSVSAIEINPTTATVNAGEASDRFEVTVTATPVELEGYTLTLDGAESTSTSISTDGKVFIGRWETATELTLTATSVADPTKTATATITVVPDEAERPFGV